MPLYVHRSEAMQHILQVLVIGKISQAAILAAAAYRNHETFKRQTGISNTRLIYDKANNETTVMMFCVCSCLENQLRD